MLLAYSYHSKLMIQTAVSDSSFDHVVMPTQRTVPVRTVFQASHNHSVKRQAGEGQTGYNPISVVGWVWRDETFFCVPVSMHRHFHVMVLRETRLFSTSGAVLDTMHAEPQHT